MPNEHENPLFSQQQRFQYFARFI